MATVQARIHQRSDDEIVRLGNRCLVLREQGCSFNVIGRRYNVGAAAVMRWIEKAQRRNSGVKKAVGKGRVQGGVRSSP